MPGVEGQPPLSPDHYWDTHSYRWVWIARLDFLWMRTDSLNALILCIRMICWIKLRDNFICIRPLLQKLSIWLCQPFCTSDSCLGTSFFVFKLPAVVSVYCVCMDMAFIIILVKLAEFLINVPVMFVYNLRTCKLQLGVCKGWLWCNLIWLSKRYVTVCDSLYQDHFWHPFSNVYLMQAYAVF